MIRDIVIHSSSDHYSSFPGLIRAGDTIVVGFIDQSLQALRDSDLHPHYQPVAVPGHAVSYDGGQSWTTVAEAPNIEPLDYGTRGGHGVSHVLDDGTELQMRREYKAGTTVPGPLTVATYRDGKPMNTPMEISDFGPFEGFYPFGIERLSDGSLLVAGYYYSTPVESPIEPRDDVAGANPNTAFFLRGTPDGREWSYCSHITNNHPFCFTESSLTDMGSGRVVCMLRNDWIMPPERMPVEANGNGMSRDGFGYFLYQSESMDYGNTWSEPVQLPIWGHPPFCLRLASGNVLMVYGHRRPPFSIRAILSTDECRTWDMSTLTTIYQADPGGCDMGYPVCTQLPSGEIFCAFYGYSTEDVGEKMPHGIFGELFSEDDLCG
jgi:hypothetical protein